MTSRTLNVVPGSKLDLLVKAELDFRIKGADAANRKQHETWRRAEEAILAYVPENEADILRRTKREQGQPVYTTLKLPYTYALLMSAHTYISSVFFARSPIHQFAGRHGEAEMNIQAMEALIEYQVTVGRAMGPYYIWIYDALKYSAGILGLYWDRDELQFSEVSELNGQRTLVTRKTMRYEGNRVYNVAPYDFLHDPRVTLSNFQKGEFCAVRKRMGWNELTKRAAQGWYMNLDKIKSRLGTSDPESQNYSMLERPDMNAISPSDNEALGPSRNHPSMVELYEVYIELIPREWQLGPLSYPEKWVITITKDLSVVLGMQPLGCLHGDFPFDVLEPEIEAYALYNRGFPEIMEPLQNTMDWLVNTHFFNTRAALNNLFVVDPSRVVMKDIEHPGPGGVIRMKPEAFGADLRTFFHQIPITNFTQQNFTDLNVMQQFGEKTLGINDQIMGGFQGGGRKTATEVRTATGFGVNRLKTIAEYMSIMGVSSHAAKLLTNSQQYYDASKKFRIVGSLAADASASFIQVTPDSIAGQYDLIPVDGTMPIDRTAQVNMWREIITAIATIPAIGQAFDLSKIFSWVATLGGLRNINQFRIQIMPPGAKPGPGMMPVPMNQSNPAGTGLQAPGLEMPQPGGM